MDSLEAKSEQIARTVQGFLAESGARLAAVDVMTDSPCCIPPETTALELVRLFHAKGFRHLLVCRADGRLAGVISDRDVLRCLGPEKRPDRAALEQLRAGQLMSTDLVTVAPDTPLEKTIGLMLQQGISCLPVVVGDRLMGIVTNTDLHLTLERLLQALKQAGTEEPLGSAACNLRI